MKKLSIICCLLVYALLSCEKKNDSIPTEKYFNPLNIDSLALKDIEGFWDDTDTNIKISDSHGFFGYDSCLIEARRCSGSEKGVVISVFTSKVNAIDAFEYRIQNVACIILPYNKDGDIEGKWWYSDCIPDIIFANQWNTIIEVFYYHVSYEEIEDIMYAAAKEIVQRVDSLSEDIE